MYMSVLRVCLNDDRHVVSTVCVITENPFEKNLEPNRVVDGELCFVNTCWGTYKCCTFTQDLFPMTYILSSDDDFIFHHTQIASASSPQCHPFYFVTALLTVLSASVSFQPIPLFVRRPLLCVIMGLDLRLDG